MIACIPRSDISRTVDGVGSKTHASRTETEKPISSISVTDNAALSRARGDPSMQIRTSSDDACPLESEKRTAAPIVHSMKRIEFLLHPLCQRRMRSAWISDEILPRDFGRLCPLIRLDERFEQPTVGLPHQPDVFGR